MAGYGTVIAFAEELGEPDHIELLNQTLEEEKQTDEKLSELAEEINAHANQGEETAETSATSGKIGRIPPAKKSRNVA